MRSILYNVPSLRMRYKCTQRVYVFSIAAIHTYDTRTRTAQHISLQPYCKIPVDEEGIQRKRQTTHSNLSDNDAKRSERNVGIVSRLILISAFLRRVLLHFDPLVHSYENFQHYHRQSIISFETIVFSRVPQPHRLRTTKVINIIYRSCFFSLPARLFSKTNFELRTYCILYARS